MSKFNYRQLSDHDKKALIDELLEVFYRAKNKDILDKFLLQLLTPSETIMVARRWQIAKRLAANESYYKINHDLKVGMSTIESVDRWLSQAIGDYRQKLEKKLMAERKKRRHGHVMMFPNTASFLLLNLLAEGALQVWAAQAHIKKQHKQNKSD